MVDSIVEIHTSEQHYSIPESDFHTPLHGISQYNEGDKINRDNFVPFLIRSFAFSLGHPVIQKEYFRWKELHENFDWQSTIDNFNSADGISNLSDQEKKLIINNYNRVKKHEKFTESSELIRDFLKEINMSIGDLHDEKLSDVQLREMSLEQLSQRSRQFREIDD